MAMERQKFQAQQHNYMAGLFLAMAVGVMYFHFQAVKATADTNVVVTRVPPAPDMPTGDSGEVQVQTLTSSSGESEHVVNLRKHLELLEAGIKHLKSVPNYSSVFSKREEVGGVLRDEEIMELKLRHKPFSVYMKWSKGDVGRELLYQEDQNEGMMLVQLGGFAGRLIPSLKLDIHGDRAMAESRYSIDNSGLLNIAQKIADARVADLKNKHHCTCQMRNGVTFDSRPCHYFVTEYADKSESPVYRRNEIYIDEQLNVPVCVRNFTWMPADRVITPEETLIEEYAFTNINFTQQIADQEFDKGNDEYRFR